MFILHSSNKTENLLEHLAMVLKTAPLASPMSAELFLIQSQGMERWLSQQLAQRFRVWGNYYYLFPSRFFNSLAENLQKANYDSRFERQQMVWRFEAVLRNVNTEAFKSLHYFLSGENLALKRYQLALQLTRIFDQYQMLRPDLLDSWQSGRILYDTETERWQAALWQMLIAEWGGEHRGQQWLNIIRYLQQTPAGDLTTQLPERVSIFGINSMPPLLLAYLQALALHCDVHLYLLNPVQNYWADLPSKRLKEVLGDFAGHPLLVRLGQQGREFQQLLLDQVSFEFEPSSFEARDACNNLQVLQNDLLNNKLELIRLQPDDSISVHACHSRLREVQVLKNQLLAALEKSTDLQLGDIIVMAPAIQLYTPYIHAVFADMQHAIADRSLRITNKYLNALLSLLHLVQSRLGWQSVLDLLEQPHVYRNFALHDEDMALIRFWITDTQVRWGKSAAHKQSLGLPAINQNTWQATLDRLFMGYAVGSDEMFVDDVLPYLHIEGTTSRALGGLNEFLQLLFKAADELSVDRTLAAWQNLLQLYAVKLLGYDNSIERQELNDLLDKMQELTDIHQFPIGTEVMVSWLEGQLDETISSNGFLRGQLTFCAMLPMRTIPFRVIALLGMNDAEFPKNERKPDFDLLAQFPRLGDRSRRADDRYQFLEILISAREQLILTYIGQSQQDNSPIPPSVIVSELLDVLRDSYQLEGLVTQHPLHAFSPAYFNGVSSGLFSYAERYFHMACGLLAEKQPLKPWWQGSIQAEASQTIDVEELCRFYQHPQRFFLQQQLGIYLPQLSTEPDEREPFTVDRLSLYGIQQRWVAELLTGHNLPLKKLQAQGEWPVAVLGEVAWQRQTDYLSEFAAIIQAKHVGCVLPPQAVDITVGQYRVIGKLENLYQNGGLLYRYSKLKGKDFMLAWLHHLLINCLQEQTTYLISTDYDLCFLPEWADQAILLTLLEIFLVGKRQPNAFFTEAAFQYVLQTKPEQALPAAIKYIQESITKGYEPEIAQLLAQQDLNTVFSEQFVCQCETLVLPIWRQARGI